MSQMQNMLGVNNSVTLPGVVNVNGLAVNPVALFSTATKAITSFDTNNSFSNYYSFPITAGAYLCGATVYTIANGTAWSANDGVRFRVIDSNGDAVAGNTLYPEVDFRPYYMTVDGIANIQAAVNNNICGVFVTTSNVNLCWQAAISNTTALPATHKLVMECPWYQKIG